MRTVTAYRGTVSRSPAFLAALASLAVPGLDPASVQAVQTDPLRGTAVAFVTDAVGRRWVVRCPLSAAAGARLDAAARMAAAVSGRVSVQVPRPSGTVEVDHGPALVSPFLPGVAFDLAGLPAGPGLAGHLGRVIAEIHGLDRRLVDELGGPVYDADGARTARLADLDRAATTGHVPASLLERWEKALDDVTLWRFAPTVVHGGLTTGAVLADFADPTTTASGSIAALLGWDDTKVADPADDFAALVSEAHPSAVDSVIEAYANARPEGVDPHLRRRALLSSEFAMVRRLLVAVSVDDPDHVRWHATRLRRLAGEVADDDFAPEAPALPRVKPTVVALDDEEAARLGEADRHTQAWDASATQEFTSPTLIARAPEPGSRVTEPSGAPDALDRPATAATDQPGSDESPVQPDSEESLSNGDGPQQPA